MTSLLLRGIGLSLLASLGLSICFAQVKPAAKKHGVEDSTLKELAADRDKFVCVTEKPHLVVDRSSWVCSAPKPSVEKKKKPENPHENYFVKVYVTNNGQKMMTSGRGTYPVGTAILKEKIHATQEEINSVVNAPPHPKAETELFTGMLKREQGYNPECGDWEFFIVSGDAKKLLARGKIDSCMACHHDYKKTDFVTREYMPDMK